MSTGSQFIDDLLIWQASELARAKKYREAETVLCLFDSAEDKYKAIAYDLLGRIMAKKKKYAEAKTYFQKAIAFDPNNTNPREALDYLPTYQRNFRLLRVIGIPSILLLIFVGGFFIASPKRTGVIIKTPPSPGANLRLQSRSSDRGPSVLMGKSKQIRASFDIGGVTTRVIQGEIRIIFDKGIFLDKCEFAKDSERLLKEVAEYLKQASEDFLIIVEGRTDNISVMSESPYKNNFVLGLQRAEKVSAFFHEKCGISENLLLAISMGDENPLFPNSLDETRASNRTVSIRIRQTK